jgi:protein O-mannosyl-transferase
MENRGWQTVLRDAVAQPAALCLVLAAATLSVYWPVTGCGFISYDDPAYFSENPNVLNGLTWPNVVWALSTNDNASWYPLTWLSYLLDATVFGKGPAGPHLTNLVLHVGNTVLLFLLLRRLTGAQWRSAFVAALFALHPLHVESVAWIAERKGLLSTMFGLLTLWAYGCYAKPVVPASIDRRPPGALRRWFFYGLALFLFACSLLSKPALVVLPCAMLLLDYWPLHRLQRSTPWCLFLEKVPFFLLGLLSSVATVWVHKQSGALAALATAPMATRIENAFASYARYLGKTLWPVRLALPYPDPGNWPLSLVMGGAVMVVGLSVLALWQARERSYVFVGWFWFAGMLLPVIGLIQWGTQSMADRYTYVPLIGLFIIVAWFAGEVLGRTQRSKRVAGFLAVLLLVVLAVRTQDQLHFWKNSESLFHHTLATTRDNTVALNNLGIWLFGQGRIDEAIEYHRRALELGPTPVDPGCEHTLYNLGNALAGAGKYAEAIESFEAALRVRPENHEARNNLANSLRKLGRVDEAATQYRSALQIKPDAAKIHKNLGDLLVGRGRLDEAVLQYREALKQEPNDAGTHYALGIVLALQGLWNESIQEYEQALRLAPNNAEAQYNLGYVLLVCGRFDQAVAHLNEALRLRPEFPMAHYNLGCALAQQGRRTEAVIHLREALRLQPDYPDARQKLVELGAKPKDENGK